MNEAACMVYLGMFLAMPPALLTTRLFDRASMPWGLLLGVSVLGGWLLANLAYMFHINGLQLQMPALGEARNDPDGFPGNASLLKFGWLLGPAYLLPWLFLYCIFAGVRWMVSSPHGVRRR